VSYAIAPSSVVLEPFTNPPGYNSVGANVAMLKAGGKRGGFIRDRHGNPVEHTTATLEQLMESATCFAGTPDDVYEQIKALDDRVGGVPAGRGAGTGLGVAAQFNLSLDSFFRDTIGKPLFSGR